MPAGLDARLTACTIEVACDVDNPLTGERGASAIFGPQKGATPAMVQTLDANLQHFAQLIERDVGVEVEHIARCRCRRWHGCGNAGFSQGQLRPGCEIIAKAVGLEAAVQDADLVITGEGRIDQQTIFGKTPFRRSHRRTQARQTGDRVLRQPGHQRPCGA